MSYIVTTAASEVEELFHCVCMCVLPALLIIHTYLGRCLPTFCSFFSSNARSCRWSAPNSPFQACENGGTKSVITDRAGSSTLTEATLHLLYGMCTAALT